MIEKCAKLIIKSGKWQMTKGIELPNQEKNQNPRRKGNLQILRNIESGHHQTSGNEIFFFNTPGEQENYLKTNYIVEISWKR